jgi:hypothetical protein
VRKVLNAMGKDGWELVSVAQDQEQVRLFLKRELSAATPTPSAETVHPSA